MMLELNDVLLRGAASTLSMMAREGRLTCLTTADSLPSVFQTAPPTHGDEGDALLTRWLYAMMGFEPVVAGFISIDGEPLTPETISSLRKHMAFVPSDLMDIGEVCVYEAPSVQDVFALKANRELSISNGLLAEEIRRTGTTGQKARLLAVAVLLQRRILLIDRPDVASLPYLRQQAQKGCTIIMASRNEEVIGAADLVVEM